MLRKLIFTVAVLLSPLFTITSLAQEEVPEQPVVEAPLIRFGVVSYETVLLAMPEYAEAQKTVEALRAKFEEETKRSEQEFNERYEAFLEQQQNYAPSILRKRQSELEDMLKRNEQFRVDAILMLEQAKKDAIKPLRDKINSTIAMISKEYALLFVLNTDADAVPYFNAENGIELTNFVIERLK